jgi:diguanylate cyclase (GGDEF)-like protein
MSDTNSLLSVIELQNELVADDRPFEEVLDLVCAKARELAEADSARIDMIESGRPVQTALVGSLPADPASTLGVAIRHGDEIAGMLTVQAAATARFESDHFECLKLLAEVIAVRLSTGTVNGSARIDAVTGLPNRRAFAERLVIEAGRARRYGHALALCIFEVQGIDRVNSELGSTAGADALAEAARILAASRVADECFRLGGHQFAVLMPQTSLEGAESAGARMSASVVAAGLGEGRVTAAFGAAAGEGDPVALHEDAAERLRMAKSRRAERRARSLKDRKPRVVAVVRGRVAPEPA